MTAAHAADAIYDDLEAEESALEVVLAGLSPGEWARPSAAANWSVADVVLHLAQTEELVYATVAGRGGALARQPGDPPVDVLVDEMVAAERGTPADEIFQRWRLASRAALRALRGAEPSASLPWIAMPLSPRTLATTRLAEHWAHALDVTGGLGLPYQDTDRLRHVAWLAVRTLPYAFLRAGKEAGAVRCELAAPGGGTWELGPADAPTVISGPAGAFCRVAARRLAAGDSALTTAGPHGAEALRLVRTYA